MRLANAREAAVEWVGQYASRQAGFRGAYFVGSTVGLADDAELPVGSDLDLIVVTADVPPPAGQGKFIYRDILLEITLLPWQQLSSAETVLRSYHLAAGLHCDTIIADPTGELRALQQQVASHFAEEIWVRRRCQNARQRIEGFLDGIDPSAPWHEQVTAWLFGTGVTTHVLLVAALRNPTVRLRYLAVREVLEHYGRSAMYSELLRLLGCTDLTAERVDYHLAALTRTFDAAAAVGKTRFLFSSDITPAARSIAIDGSRRLIHSGNHREAVFWIVATFARCHQILSADSPHRQGDFAPAFDEALADLGIRSTDDLMRRAESVRQFLPALWRDAEAIIAANPDVQGET